MTDTSIEKLTELVEKYKWQVRDTCIRAENAERERDVLREALKTVLSWQAYCLLPDKVLQQIRTALEAKP